MQRGDAFADRGSLSPHLTARRVPIASARTLASYTRLETANRCDPVPQYYENRKPRETIGVMARQKAGKAYKQLRSRKMKRNKANVPRQKIGNRTRGPRGGARRDITVREEKAGVYVTGPHSLGQVFSAIGEFELRSPYYRVTTTEIP